MLNKTFCVHNVCAKGLFLFSSKFGTRIKKDHQNAQNFDFVTGG